MHSTHANADNNALDVHLGRSYHSLGLPCTRGASFTGASMKTFLPRPSTVLSVLFAGLLLAAGPACAQNYPAKPVSLMVPYPAGGPSDATARIFTVPLGKALGPQVVGENLGGDSGAL